MEHDDCLDIRLLGRLEIFFQERLLAFPTRHAAFLIALLAREGQLRRETAAARLWGERDEVQARASLRQTIYHIQKVFTSAGAPELDVSRQTIGLQRGSFRCDVDTLLADLTADPVTVTKTYRGELLGDVGRIDPAFQDWLDLERKSLENRISEAMTITAGSFLADRNWAGLEAVASLRLQIDPYNEDALRHRMEALSRTERRASALALFEEFRERLGETLQIEPEPATYGLRDQLSARTAGEPSPPPEPALPDPPAVPSGDPDFRERRSVSLLAVAPIASTSDPEEFAAVFAQVRALLEKTLVDGSAQIVEQAGAAIACVFGASGLVERHADAAVYAARALAERAGDEAKVAVVSGDIVDSATESPAVPGHAVLAPLLSDAQTLLQTAKPGQCVLSPATELRLKARPQNKAFLARQSELETLHAAFLQARQGNAQIVGVVGEAGIGKSTLLRQFLETREDVQILLIEGYEREASRSFGAIARFLATQISAGDEPDRASIDAAIKTKQIRAVYREVLLGLLGLATDEERSRLVPEEQRRQVFKLASEVILAASARQEVILAVEDVHWLDRDSAEFLDRLVGEISAEPLTVIATFRPEFQVSWTGRSSFRLLRLTPLQSKEAEALIAPWAGGMSDQTRDQLLSRAAGNPFLLVETARAIASSDSLQYAAVPETIRDVLNAHIRRLPADDRRVLQCAAVLGFEAADSGIADLAGLTEAQLDESLTRLRQEEIVHKAGIGTAARHRFRHALLHDAVYASIPKTDSGALHAKACALLQERTDMDPAAIALHAWRSEDWPAAVEWFSRAADRYTALSSYALAAQAYRQAVEALERSGEDTTRQRLDLALKLRPVLVPLGLYEDALEELDLAETIAASLIDGGFHVAVQISKSYLFSTHGHLHKAIEYARSAGMASRRGQQTDYEAKLAEAQARSLMGDWEGTLALLAPTVPFWEDNRHERFGHTGTRSVWCHGHLSNAYGLNGQLEAALRHGERAFDLANETKRPLDVIFSLHRLGRVHLVAGNAEEALALLMDAVRRSEEIDAPIFRSWFACDAVPVLLAAGRNDEAANLLNRQLEAARKLKLRQFEGWLQLNKAELLRTSHRLREAEAEANAALACALEIGDLVLEPAAMLTLAAFRTGSGKCQDKKTAMDLAEKRGYLFLTRQHLHP